MLVLTEPLVSPWGTHYYHFPGSLVFSVSSELVVHALVGLSLRFCVWSLGDREAVFYCA